MVEGRVDDGVRLARAIAQAFEIFERAAMGLGAHRCECLRSGIGAGETEYLMARRDELADDGGADKSGRAGHEDAHVKVSNGSETDIARALIMLK
jgi:hypothetical protein